MASRTLEGKHVTRFIVLKKSENNGDAGFVRSVNIPEFFSTREAAQSAIATRRSSVTTTQYRVRQK
jgi:hypothetical protein